MIYSMVKVHVVFMLSVLNSITCTEVIHHITNLIFILKMAREWKWFVLGPHWKPKCLFFFLFFFPVRSSGPFFFFNRSLFLWRLSFIFSTNIFQAVCLGAPTGPLKHHERFEPRQDRIPGFPWPSCGFFFLTLFMMPYFSQPCSYCWSKIFKRHWPRNWDNVKHKTLFIKKKHTQHLFMMMLLPQGQITAGLN